MAVLAAILLVVLVGLGAIGFGWLSGGDSPPLTYSSEERGYHCGSITYLPAASVARTRRHDPPAPTTGAWSAFRDQPGAKPVGGDVVRVSVRGGTAKELTMTGIGFSVEQRRRPGGAAFAAPCQGVPVEGRGFQADVEAVPPRMVSSSANPRGTFSAMGLSAASTRPVAFPWTVSLARPLVFYVVATARSCYCVWRARIPWVSGDERGVIRVDDQGRGYEVVGIEGLSSFSAIGGSWHQFRVAHAQG